jgi:hypothetical protein
MYCPLVVLVRCFDTLVSGVVFMSFCFRKVLASASVTDSVKRGLPGDVNVTPPNEDNCQFSLGAVLLSAPSFATSSEWMAFLKTHNAAVQEARKQVMNTSTGSVSSSPSASSSSSLPEPTTLAAACAALVAGEQQEKEVVFSQALCFVQRRRAAHRVSVRRQANQYRLSR